MRFDLSKNQKSSEPIKELILKTVKEQKPETASQLIMVVQKTTGLSEEEIVNLLNQLETEDKIHFNLKQETVNLASFRNYFFSSELAWYWITIAVAIASTIAVFIIPLDLVPLVYARNVLGVIFVLFLPGYTFMKVFFPTKVPNKTFTEPLANIERIVLSVGMSIALTSIVGLILYYTPIGIGLNPITLSLLVLTIVFATASVIREFNAKTITI